MARRFSTSPAKIGYTPRINVRANKIKLASFAEKPIIPLAGMNQPETKIAYALNDLKIRYRPQSSFFGGSTLGGARADFDLFDYNIVLNYDGPFHGTTEGRARDAIVNQTYVANGKRPISLYERDLKRLKPRIMEIIGTPLQ